VSVESGVGWVPFALEHLDWQWLNCGVPREHPEYDLLPSEYFKRQMFGCFWFERASVRSAIDQMGPDWVLYESDFPHPTSMAPGPATAAVEPREYIARELGDLSPAVLRKILHDNAATLYHLEPLSGE
jgi:predicted TIM-barrel fold metal-dependent hydrolase